MKVHYEHYEHYGCVWDIHFSLEDRIYDGGRALCLYGILFGGLFLAKICSILRAAAVCYMR